MATEPRYINGLEIDPDAERELREWAFAGTAEPTPADPPPDSHPADSDDAWEAEAEMRRERREREWEAAEEARRERAAA